MKSFQRNISFSILVFFISLRSNAIECRWIHPEEKFGSILTVSKDYHQQLKSCSSKHDQSLWIGIRELKSNGTKWILLVNPQDLSSHLASESCMNECQDISIEQVPDVYGQALSTAYAQPDPLQNDGITRSRSSRLEYFLTIDLCPSQKHLDYSFFQNLMVHSRSTPVAIALSGGWMRAHTEDLRWLQELNRKNLLRITWVNHTNTHPYHPGVSIEKNFLLSEGVELTQETLDAEIEFLKNGILPPAFFRFPGLVSNQQKMKELQNLSLIPLGAEAWLGIGNKLKNGSIILVHGNGNEPKGLAEFNRIFEENNAWTFLREIIDLVF